MPECTDGELLLKRLDRLESAMQIIDKRLVTVLSHLEDMKPLFMHALPHTLTTSTPSTLPHVINLVGLHQAGSAQLVIRM